MRDLRKGIAMMSDFVSIGIATALDVWLRWSVNPAMNSIFPTERITKYNRLLTIEAELGKDALFQDSNPYRRRGH